MRRPIQKQRVPYKKRKVTTGTAASTSMETCGSEQGSDSESNSDTESDTVLQNWDGWMDIESDSDLES